MDEKTEKIIRRLLLPMAFLAGILLGAVLILLLIRESAAPDNKKQPANVTENTDTTNKKPAADDPAGKTPEDDTKTTNISSTDNTEHNSNTNGNRTENNGGANDNSTDGAGNNDNNDPSNTGNDGNNGNNDTSNTGNDSNTGGSNDNTSVAGNDGSTDNSIGDNTGGSTAGNSSAGGGTTNPTPTPKPAPVYPAHANNTGNLTETGNGYEGVKGTGTYNYGEALQKSLLFYELQRSGALPEETRCNWRGDSALEDGKDAGLDLTGGWFDAGDNVKFNLPMAYTAAMLGWSILDDADAYRESGQLKYAMENVKWANDYFIKCHPQDNVYYYQVGDGSQDHTYWGAAETVSYKMNRPSYCVTKENPGSAVCGETAASLAICSMVYAAQDAAYSKLCLSHAKSLYKFARETASDAGYTAANGFYNSWSGFYDELSWAGAWLYLATKDETYLKNARIDYEKSDQNYKWAMCWDDVHIGAAVLLSKITGEKKYANAVEEHLDWWTTGTASGERITYTPKGLAWLDSWGSLRYATTTGFIAITYAESDACGSAKAKTYRDFAKKQADYALGDTGFSYEIGFGENYPHNPHHRTAQGSYCDNMNEPATARHTLYGALVGGPDASDGYQDVVSNYTNNEVACDYNAGFTGLLAKLYKTYHGYTLKDFGAVEPVTENEFYASGGINVDGTDFIELRVFVCNTSAWPARVPENLEFRYYMDLSELYNAGQSVENIMITTNYMQAGKVQPLVCHDEAKHIYYLSVSFADSLIYPGGQDAYKKEIQVRIRNTAGVWDNSNDPSYAGMQKGANVLLTKSVLYECGTLIFGEEPPSGKNAGKKVGFLDGTGSGGTNGSNSGQNGSNGNSGGTGSGGTQTSGNSGSGQNGTVSVIPTAKNEHVSVSMNYDNLQASASSISGSLNIKNESDGSLALSDLKIQFYFTNENGAGLSFACYHAAKTGATGSYMGLNGCTGTYQSITGKDADTVCCMTFSDKALLEAGDTLTVNFCINHSDWSNMTTTNDHSVKSAENIVILHQDRKIFGTEPLNIQNIPQ